MQQPRLVTVVVGVRLFVHIEPGAVDGRPGADEAVEQRSRNGAARIAFDGVVAVVILRPLSPRTFNDWLAVFAARSRHWVRPGQERY